MPKSRRSKSAPPNRRTRRKHGLIKTRFDEESHVRFIDEQIRFARDEYELALEYKKLNGYDINEYYLEKPSAWNNTIMGKWPHQLPLNHDASSVPKLFRQEATHRIKRFNEYYRNIFDTLLKHRLRVKDLQKNSNVENGIYVLNKITRGKKYSQLGKSEIVKNLSKYLGPNNLTYETMKTIHKSKSLN